jgi:two-component system, NtrC family, response regulator PilR
VTRRILGESPAVHELLKLIHQVARAKTNVLIIGESGTGKELVARTIHEEGPFKDKPFIPVNCGAIPENLIESEMFGHRKGSFTGAVQDKMGLFEAANHGTLFLDEVGELSMPMQVKLLRAIQERCFRKVGGVEDIKVDVRIIAATNRDLEAAVSKGTFREDLYYRLNVILIKTPPLRDRKGDIHLLASEFLKKFSKRANKEINSFDSEAMSALEAYTWPGNIRELENSIERAVTLESGSNITLGSLPLNAREAKNKLTASTTAGVKMAEFRLPPPDFSNGALDLDKILGEVERVYLLEALKQAGGAKKKAADLLGITFRSLRYRLQKQGLGSD